MQRRVDEGARAFVRFSALRRAVLGSMIAAGVVKIAQQGFSALRRAVLGSMRSGGDDQEAPLPVSVLSDEPCWGQ